MTAEQIKQILDEVFTDQSFPKRIYGFEVAECMKKAYEQGCKDGWNGAIDFAVENARVDCIAGKGDPYFRLDKDSILIGKIK